MGQVAKASNAVVSKQRHKVREKVMKANWKGSVSCKKASKELSHDVVSLRYLLHTAAAKKVKDLAMTVPSGAQHSERYDAALAGLPLKWNLQHREVQSK